jgi:heptosyltransferase II
MWIGDFVRCHTVVKLLKQRFPSRPIDVLTSASVSPLLDYMPGVRKGIIADLPRRQIALGQHHALARRLRREGYGQALVMPRTWKAALALYLAGIPQRTGFVGEGRFGLINDLRWGERQLPRMVERCAALALPKGESLPAEWPLPELVASPSEVAAWRQRLSLVREKRMEIALAPGAVGPSKRWPSGSYADLGRRLISEGHRVWVVGGPSERALAAEIAGTAPDEIRDLTGPDLRNAILALAAADVAISNDSGLLHVAAALDTPAIGIFGPTSPLLWAPLNPLAACAKSRSSK